MILTLVMYCYEWCSPHLYRKWVFFAKTLYGETHKLSAGPNMIRPDINK